VEPSAGAGADKPLGSMRSPELTGTDTTLLIPVGSVEQHGPHLPLDTDTRIAVAVAERVAARLRGLLVAPPVAYGASGEHRGVPGTISCGTDALHLLLVELGRSADLFAGVVFVNGHGGNHDAVSRAVTTLTGEQRRALAWSPRIPGGDAHAGRTETSLLLALAPEVVRLDAAEAGNTSPLAELLPRLRTEGVAAVSSNGVLGDPAGASAAEGSTTLGALVDDAAAAIGPFCHACARESEN
jgi:creatinine amidohydrolase